MPSALTLELCSPETPLSETAPSARLEALDGERVTLVASISAPPGAPLVLRVGADLSFEARVRSCRRVGGGFLLQARLVNLSNLAREQLFVFMNRATTRD